MNLPSSVLDRQERERQWHDQKYSEGKDWDVSRGMSSSYRFFWQVIGPVDGLKILDFGCGNGWISIKYAEAGARVCGIDISKELIKKGRQWVVRKGLEEKVSLEVMAGEELTYDDHSFDLVIGSAVLHHTDLKLALNGIHRVLRPGGRGIFIEPLNQNIALKAWRMVTPWRRSPMERALTVEDLDHIKTYFPRSIFKYFGLTSMVTEGIQMILGPSKPVQWANNILQKVDNKLTVFTPALGPYSAVCVMQLIKEP